MSQTTWTCPELLIKKGELLSPFRFSTKPSPHLDQGQSTQVYCVQWHLEIIFRASVHMVPSYHEVHPNTQPVPWKISAVTANETVHSVFRVPESGACETQRGKKHSSSTFGKALWYRRKGTVPGQRAQKTGIWAQSHTYRLCPLDVSSASLSLSLSQETETVLTISSSCYFFWKAYDKGHENSWQTRKYCLNCKTSFIHSSYKRNHLYEGSEHLEGAVRGWLYESSHPLCRYHLILVVLIGPCTWNYIQVMPYKWWSGTKCWTENGVVLYLLCNRSKLAANTRRGCIKLLEQWKLFQSHCRSGRKSWISNIHFLIAFD